MRRHPLARALRVDKLTLAALEATLRGPPTPAHEYLHADPRRLRDRCERLAAATGGAVVPSVGTVGGGGAPGVAAARLGGRAARRAGATAADRTAAGGRPGREGRAADRPALRAGRATVPIADVIRGDHSRCGTRQLSRARHRHRRSRRSREVDAGPRADRDGAGPVGRGAPPRHDDRPRLRLDDAAVRADRGVRRRAGAPAVHRQHAGRARDRRRP